MKSLKIEITHNRDFMTEPEIHCRYSEIWPLDRFKPNPANPNRHPDAQLRIYGKVIRANGWRRAIVVSTLSGLITKGHGALAAAKLAGLTVAPVDLQSYATSAEEIADMLADNNLAAMSELDDGAVAELLAGLVDQGFDQELAGIVASVVATPDEPEEEKGVKSANRIVAFALDGAEAFEFDTLKASMKMAEDKAFAMRLVSIAAKARAGKGGK